MVAHLRSRGVTTWTVGPTHREAGGGPGANWLAYFAGSAAEAEGGGCRQGAAERDEQQTRHDHGGHEQIDGRPAATGAPGKPRRR